jgi:hypothetical protein
VEEKIVLLQEYSKQDVTKLVRVETQNGKMGIFDREHLGDKKYYEVTAYGVVSH